MEKRDFQTAVLLYIAIVLTILVIFCYYNIDILCEILICALILIMIFAVIIAVTYEITKRNENESSYVQNEDNSNNSQTLNSSIIFSKGNKIKKFSFGILLGILIGIIPVSFIIFTYSPYFQTFDSLALFSTSLIISYFVFIASITIGTTQNKANHELIMTKLNAIGTNTNNSPENTDRNIDTTSNGD